MSTDGATDKPRPARSPRGDDRGLASIALGVLLVLALIATIVMVFSDNPVWMRIGTLSALWAAFIGAFLVARYRRQAAAEAARVRDLHTVYELQLEREISARREHELVVERDLRASVRAETSDSIIALRQEIAALREQLGAMGVTLPEDRFAVGGLGPAGQLGAGSSLPSVPSERVAPRRRSPGASSSASGSESAPGSSVSGVSPDATPSTERTDRLSPVSERSARSAAPAGEPRRPAVRPAGGTRGSRPSSGTGESSSEGRSASAPPTRAQTVAPSGSPSAPDTAPRPGSAQPETETSAPGRPAPGKPEHGRHEKAAASDDTDTSQRSASTTSPSAESAPQSRHGEGSGLSVAELMARLGGDNAPASGRRRRRAED